MVCKRIAAGFLVLTLPATAWAQGEPTPTSRAVVEPTTQVYESPSADHIIDVLPLGTPLQPGALTNGFVAITLAGDRPGYVRASAVGTPGVDTVTLPPTFANGDVCGCVLPSSAGAMWDDSSPTREAIQANAYAGIDYCVHPFADDSPCERIRPSVVPGRDLGARERALGPHTRLNDRFALWTQALAPESDYRQHASVAVLKDSPLFAPHPGKPHVNAWLGDHFPRLFHSAELHAQRSAPDGTWLFVVTPQATAIQLGQPGAFGVPGPFPSASFTLNQDYTVSLTESFEVVLYDPCAMSFTATTLDALRFNPATGALSGTPDDPELSQRLAHCRSTLNAQAHSIPATGSQFVMAVDQTATKVLTQVLTSQEAMGRTIPGDEHLAVEFGAYPVHEVRIGPADAPVGFLRTAVHSECGSDRSTALQFHDGTAWQMLSISAEVEFCSP